MNAKQFGSYNEWDLLREVIVGSVQGAHFPDEPLSMFNAVYTKDKAMHLAKNRGKAFPKELIDAASHELELLSEILIAEGVKVRRPEVSPELFSEPISGEGWKTAGGFYAAMPRDCFIPAGAKIIESAFAWRSRQNDAKPFYKILSELKQSGAVCIPKTPKPALKDDFYKANFIAADSGKFESVIKNSEICFDAADFVRFGRDFIVQETHVTNRAGIEYVRSLLSDEVNIHTICFNDPKAMHLDASILPLKAGLALINPERVPEVLRIELLSGIFKGWDFVEAPLPQEQKNPPLFLSSAWINMNILSIDENRVIVEKQDGRMAALIKSLGLKPILCPFQNFYSFGGSFHCATLDIDRGGRLEKFLAV